MTKAYLAPCFTQARTQSAGGTPSLCLGPHMVSLTFPVNVCVTAATAGTEANPIISTAITIQIFKPRDRDIISPPSCLFRVINLDAFLQKKESKPTTKRDFHHK